MAASYGAGVWVILSLYFLVIFGIAVYAYFRNRTQMKSGEVLKQHYLAGSTLGSIVLMFSFVASMYSGYAMVGLPAEAYARGFISTRWAGSAVGVVLSGVALMPLLRKVSQECGYTSCLDVLFDRFGNKPLLHGAIIISLAVPTFMYMVGQFTAFGGTIEALSTGKIPSVVASIALALMLLFYESFGGLTAVALTDVIQGLVLIVGSCMFFVFVSVVFGGLPKVAEILSQDYPDRVVVPEWSDKFTWLGWIVQSAAGPVYPHFHSRVLAAKSPKALKNSLIFVGVSPFLVLLPASLLGIAAIPFVHDAPNAEVFGEIMGQVLNYNTFLYVCGSLILAASVAAIMSTSDSLLIAFSHLICLDVFRMIRPQATDKQLLTAGKILSVVAAAAAVLISELQVNLSTLLQMQNSLALQTVPTYLFGILMKNLHWGACFLGLCVGDLITVLFVILEYPAPQLWSISMNLLVVFIFNMLFNWTIPHDARNDKYSSKYKQSVLDFKLTTDQPLAHPMWLGGCCIVALFSVPFWAIPGDNGAQALVGGMPVWAFLSYVFTALSMCVLCVVMFAFWPPEEEASTSCDSPMETLTQLEEPLVDEQPAHKPLELDESNASDSQQ